MLLSCKQNTFHCFPHLTESGGKRSTIGVAPLGAIICHPPPRRVISGFLMSPRLLKIGAPRQLLMTCKAVLGGRAEFVFFLILLFKCGFKRQFRRQRGAACTRLLPPPPPPNLDILGCHAGINWFGVQGFIWNVKEYVASSNITKKKRIILLHLHEVFNSVLLRILRVFLHFELTFVCIVDPVER